MKVFLTMKLSAVSIIIPTHNRAQLISRAIKSVLVQVEPDDEIIVVDDGSTDNTAEVIAKYGQRVKYIRTTNQGAGAARNRGIQEATRPMVAFLDSDDEWMPYKLQLQRSLMQAMPDVLFAFSDFAATDNAGKATRRFLINWHHDPRPWDKILAPGESFSSIGNLPAGCDDFQFYIGDLGPTEIESTYVLTSSMIARRCEAAGALHFAEDVATLEDYECFGRLALAGSAAYLDVETTWQHGHVGERLTDFVGIRRTTAQLTIVERVWGTNETFLMKHEDLYQNTRERFRLEMIRELISLGRTCEARNELRLVRHAPIVYSALSFLPGVIVKGLLLIRKCIRQGFHTLKKK